MMKEVLQERKSYQSKIQILERKSRASEMEFNWLNTLSLNNNNIYDWLKQNITLYYGIYSVCVYVCSNILKQKQISLWIKEKLKTEI